MSHLVTSQAGIDPGSISGSIIDNALGSEFNVVVFEANERLYYKGSRVICTSGDIITRRFDFQRPVVDCFYTMFGSPTKKDRERSLVIVFSDQIKVYAKNGGFKVVSFPFHIERAFPFQSGAIFNKVPSQTDKADQRGSTFLTLLNPLNEPGLIVSSSINSFAANDKLVCFPETAEYCLAVLYNKVEHKLDVYHIRYLANNSRGPRKKSGSYGGLRKSSMRSTSGASSLGDANTTQPLTPSSSRLMDDGPVRWSSNLSHDRMTSGEMGLDLGNTTTGTFDTLRLSKDIIFTKINSFPDTDPLKVFNLSYYDQEAVVVCNEDTIQFHFYTNPASVVSLPTYKSSFTKEGKDTCRFSREGYIVLINSEGQLTLLNPFLNLSTAPLKVSATALDGSCGSSVVYQSDGRHLTLNLCTSPHDTLVAKLLHSFKYLSGSDIYEQFWIQWCAIRSAPDTSDWNAFVITLLSMTSLLHSAQLTDESLNRNEITRLLPLVQHLDTTLDSLLPMIIISIHLVREDMRLNTLATANVDRLAVLLAQFTSWMAWSDKWVRYYNVDFKCLDRQTKSITLQPITVPPNLFQSLVSLFSEPIVPYVTFSQLVEEDESTDEKIIPRTYYVLRLFEILISPQFSADDLVRTMSDYGIKISDLVTYPAGIYVILKNKIVECQKQISSQRSLGPKELRLIDRKDLLQFDDPESVETLLSSQISAKNMKQSIGPKQMSQILQYVNSTEVLSPWDGQAEADTFHVIRLIFSEDRRFYEVTRILQTSKVQTAMLRLPSTMDENEKLVKQRALGSKIALRTMTMPIGRSAVFYSSKKPLVTEKFPIPKMNFNALILPDMISVSLEKDSVDEYLMDWGYFHNGASAGLMVSKDFKEINGSWIVFNRPQQLNAQHAGFLLGLGLNGHLKDLEEWHIYNYLGPKHSYTSIGLLLGMAASLKGTMDTKLTKVLSVHVVALLPTGSTNLNVQLSVQTAGIIGIGLLYMGSQHRRMSEILLSQISSILTINEQVVVNEGYRLAAGIALGYVNLGKGELLIDTHIIDRLVSLATRARDIQTSAELDKSSGGAIMALMMMFLRTNNEEIAHKLAVPETSQLLDYIRPDFLLLRCLAQNLIMWDYIEPTRSWVADRVPECVDESLEKITDLDSDFLPYLNILGGLLLSIAIKFASTGNLVAKETLLDYFDKLMLLCSKEPENYDERVALTGARNIRDVLMLGLSIIMAGTGDLDIMRRSRFLQGMTDKYTNYGNYTAVNTALGFLFLGGGQQGFNTDDNFSIAALLTSIYPVYSTNNYECLSECSEVLLQALRHFWALAVENRCLVVRNIADKQPIKVDVEIELKDSSSLRMSSPCLLPSLNKLSKIVVCPSEDDKYFTVQIDQADKFKQNLSVFTYERPQYQDLTLAFDSMVALEEAKDKSGHDTGPIGRWRKLSIFKDFKDYEDNLYVKGSRESSAMDMKMELQHMLKSTSVDKLWNLNLIFNYVDHLETTSRKSRAESRILQRARVKDSMKGELLDVDMDDGGDDSFNDTFESHFKVRPRRQCVPVEDGMHYLSVKFIEQLRNELFDRFGNE